MCDDGEQLQKPKEAGRDAAAAFVLSEPESISQLKENSGIFKPRPYFWLEIRLSTHREQFGESWRPSKAIQKTRDRHIFI